MQVQNTWEKGLNRDLSLSLFQKNTYWDMLNMRLVTDEGLSSGTPQNIKGNLLQLTIPDTSPVVLVETIVAPINLDATVIITITSSTGTTPYTITFLFDSNWEANFADQINANIPFVNAVYKPGRVVIYGTLNLNINEVTDIVVAFRTIDFTVTIIVPALSNLQIMGWEAIREEIYLLTCSDPADNYGQIWKLNYNKVSPSTYILTLLYNNTLAFSLDYPVANPGGIQGNYEGNSIIRLYWTNNLHSPKVLNTADPNLMALNSNSTGIQPLVNYSIPILTNISNGSLLTGLYQYAYRLKLNIGGETVFSQLSSVIPVNIHSEATSTYIEYRGGSSELNSGKSHQLSISNVDTSYDRIEIISLYYPDINSIPIIEIIKDDPIPDSGTYNFTHVGTEIGIPITLDEFNIINTVIERVKTLTAKNNFLFFGNIKEGIYDTQWDARAYRFNSNISLGGQKARVQDIAGTQIDIDTTSVAVYPNQWGVPETHDAINPNQDITSLSLNVTENNPYIYQSDGITLGGEGVNIKYSFATQRTNLDTQTLTTSGYAPDVTVARSAQTYNFDNYTRVNQGNTFKDFHSPYLSAQLKGYTRGETYRFGIVFFDLSGNQSYTKWIGDITFPHVYMPDVNNNPLNSTNKTLQFPTSTPDPTNSSITRAENLGITFQISNIPQGTSGFSIVRCERKKEDKSVLGQGYFQVAYSNTNPSCTADIFLTDDGYNTGSFSYFNSESITLSPAGVRISDTYASVFIPEHLFGTQSFSFQQGDKIELIGKLNNVHITPRIAYHNSVSPSSGCTNVFSNISSLKNYSWNSSTLLDVKTQTSNTYNAFIPLLDTKTISPWSGNPVSTTMAPGTQPIYNVSVPRDVTSTNDCFKDSMNQGITTLLVSSNSGPFQGIHRFGSSSGQPNRSFTDGIAGSSSIYIVNYLRNASLQYGGNSYSQRTDSEYISTGHYQDTGDISYSDTIFGGDTFINIFDIMPRKKHFSQGDGFTFSTNMNPAIMVVSGIAVTASPSVGVIRYFPVESTVNIDLRETLGTLPYTCGTGSVINVAIPNKSNFDNGLNINGPGASIFDTQDEFIYDTKYSKENNTRKFFPKPIIITTDGTHDTRIRVSQQKTNNEVQDSWTVFKEEDYLDADTIQGAITNLMIHQDRLVVFQERGISIASVNERSLIQDNQGADLVLGSGGVLTRYDYISKIIGSQHQFGFTQSNDSVFFFDMRNKNLYKLRGNSAESISVIKGLSSYFGNNLNGIIQTHDNPFRNKGITATYDFKYNEALFSFKDIIGENTTGFTIAYNDFIDEWETRYSFLPSVYINDKRNFFSTKGNIDDRTGQISNNFHSLWIHDKGAYGSFYGTVYPSSLTMIVNPEPNERKLYDNFQWSTRSLGSTGINIIDDTFTNIRLYNSYQNSDYRLFPGTIDIIGKRKERLWNLAGVRSRSIYNTPSINIFDTVNISPTNLSFAERFRDTHLFIDLIYNNLNNNKLTLDTFKTDFRVSTR